MTRRARPQRTPPREWDPLPEDEHEAQVASLVRELRPVGRVVLDLGCGNGRVSGPLARAGHSVLALDSDPKAVRACRALHPQVTVRRADYLDPRADFSLQGRAPDAIVCLGYTFTLLHDPADALRLLRRLADAASAGARLYLDDFAPLWSELTEGRWTSGVSEEGDMQLVWKKGDSVFALRHDEDVDRRAPQVRKSDRLHRLWTVGELRLLASISGWTGPRTVRGAPLIRFTRAR